MMRRQMRFAAVLVVVVLALTGFSTSSSGGKSGKSRSSGGSGGGCSSSKKSNGSYHDYDDDYDSSSSSSGGSTYESATPVSETVSLRVIRCAQQKKGKRRAYTASSVEVRSTATEEHTYDVDVTFVDAKGLTVDTGEADITLAAGEKQIISVPMDSPRSVSRVKRCQVTAELRY
ncbi:hypothetical protein AB0P41_14580 [Streptomyces sp. NPDC079167]|uniref:hypothetical protein n=1 Tax=Streptomyces sp. NPDC079167 TaxID=3154513 RepID=UPI0034196978